MFYFVTFGKFGREEHWKNDRKIFLDKLRDLIEDYTGNLIDYKESSELEIIKLLKPILRRNIPQYFLILIILMILWHVLEYLIRFSLKKKKKK